MLILLALLKLENLEVLSLAGIRTVCDEFVSEFISVHGCQMKELVLADFMWVSNHTALSLARNCRNLWSLDLSWCRNLTNEALGLIVDSCSLLEVVKLFGSTQVTNVFVDGHPNPQVKLIGLKMSPLLKHIDVPDFLLGPLRYSSTLLEVDGWTWHSSGLPLNT
ncbi:hypothetical protein CDL12_10343 [Handroanthus impetiginosus]|uniref:Uncharacterized protein n=1 Tax=Handroanthus impetiginosus TaxID=429701 RepID=A0A2G9HHM1_9LAMI|nr:hypothetical protein CDL12_10343 [Handroanthus impetiginosus]